MQPEIDLEYDLATLVPAVTLDEIREFERELSEYFEMEFKLPDDFIQQLLFFHGGIPGKQCFQMPDGIVRMICRFCNILDPTGDEKIPKPWTHSWRPGGAIDIRLDYSILHFYDRFDYEGRLSETDNLFENKSVLVPIATIDTAGGFNAREMGEVDLLCLNYQGFGEPSVVTWSFEMSWSTPEMTVKVADSFSEFITMLYKRPEDFSTTNECDNF